VGASALHRPRQITQKTILRQGGTEAYWIGPGPPITDPMIPVGVDLRRRREQCAAPAVCRFLATRRYDSATVSSRSSPYRQVDQPGLHQAFAYTDAPGLCDGCHVVERDGKFYYPGVDGEIRSFQGVGKSGKSRKFRCRPRTRCATGLRSLTLRVVRDVDGPRDGRCTCPWATEGGRREAHTGSCSGVAVWWATSSRRDSGDRGRGSHRPLAAAIAP